VIRERGLQLEADVVAGNKTGHFLDQRDNRALVRASVGAYPKGAEVLDVFSHTGGFALSAAAGGARKVHMVDVSAAALEAASRNFALNRHIHAVRECQIRTTVGDAFDVLAQLHRDDYSFDVVILDPPSFAHAERNVAKAEQAYFRLTQAGLRLLRPGGLLVQASCSSRIDDDSFYRIVHEAAVHARRDLTEIRRTGHPIDHPVGFEYGAYLKAVFARARN
jgi:23S rRNA (cytosine1962-C5)-methyltransferase